MKPRLWKLVKQGNYIPADHTNVPGYLARRMKEYRKKVEEEQLAAEAELHQQRMTEMGAFQ